MRIGLLPRALLNKTVVDVASAHAADVVHAVTVEWGQASASALVCVEKGEGARFVECLLPRGQRAFG